MKLFSDMQLIRAFKNRQEPECVRSLADSYWHVLLITSVLLAVAAIAHDVWQFSDVDRVISQQSGNAAPATDTLPFDRAQLQTIVDGFAQRQLTYQLYSSQAPAIADPSSVNVKPTPSR